MTIENIYLENPIRINLIKQHLRVYSEDEDELIEMYANNALAYIEEWVNGNVRECKTTISVDTVRINQEIQLPRFRNVLSVKSNNTTIPDSDYMIYDNCIIFWKEYTNVVIEYMQTKINIKYLQQCINLIVGDWYENRENSTLEKQSISTNVSTCVSRMLAMHAQAIK